MIQSTKILDELGHFFTALTFLTRLPVSHWSIQNENSLLKSSAYFPVVGVCVGLICAFAYIFSANLWSENIAIILALSVGIIVTGAFHEDGFADLLDSMGAFEKDKKLQIMKDSRLGTYGVCGLICLLLIKFFTLQSLIASNQNIIIIFVVAHCLSRWCCLPLIYFNDYVSPNSNSGKDLIANATNSNRFLLSTVFSAILVLSLSPNNFILILLGLGFVLLATQTYFRRKFGGITGDCLGAANQLTETMIFLVFALHVH